MRVLLFLAICAAIIMVLGLYHDWSHKPDRWVGKK